MYGSTGTLATSYAINVRRASLELPWDFKFEGYVINWSKAEQVTRVLLKAVRQSPSQYGTEFNYTVPQLDLCFYCKSVVGFQGLHHSCPECKDKLAALDSWHSFSYMQEYLKTLEFASRLWQPMTPEQQSQIESSTAWMKSFMAPAVPSQPTMTHSLETPTKMQRLQARLNKLKP